MTGYHLGDGKGNWSPFEVNGLRPGEWDAIQKGCTCTVRDGEPVQSEEWPDWLVRGCPLHDPNLAPSDDFNTRGLSRAGTSPGFWAEARALVA